MKQPLPPYFENSYESIYGNFGYRFLAVILDGLIMAPITLVFYLFSFSKIEYQYFIYPLNLILMLLYHTALPARFGATPGKRLLGMTIVKSDGGTIVFKDALLRYMPMLALGVIGIFTNFVALHYADSSEFAQLTWMEKTKYLNSLNPVMYYSQLILTYSFLFVNLIVFLTQVRMRSLSDLSGDTVVVYDRHLEKVKSFFDKN